MSELTNVFARNMRDLRTPNSTGADPKTFDNAKIPIGNAPQGFEGTEALTVKQLKDLAADGRKEELEDVTLKIKNEEIRAKEVEATLIKNKADKAKTLSGYGITDAYTQGETDSKVASLESKKANKIDVDTAFSNLSTTANKYYSTLAAANADIANIALNQSVTIGEEANSGLWEKKTAGATSLTKSPYDPLAQAKADATTKANAAEANAKNYTNQKTQGAIRSDQSDLKDQATFAFTDSRGVRTWLEVTEDGSPTEYARTSMLKSSGVLTGIMSKYSTGNAVTFVDSEDRILGVLNGDEPASKEKISTGVDLSTWAFFGSSSMGYMQDDIFTLLQNKFDQIRTPKYYGTSASLLGHQLADIGCNDGYVSFNDGVIDNTERTVTVEDFYIGGRGAHQTVGELENGIKGILLRYTFKATDDIQVPIDPNLRLKFTSKEYEPKNAVAVVNLGKNSITSLDADKTVIEGTRRAVEYLDSFNQRHTIIIGHFVNTNQTELAKQNIINVNNWMKSLYFDRFIDVQKYLMSEQVWADVGLSKTQEDIDAIAAGVLPPSLGRDSAHLSAAVDIKLAEQVLNLVISKGWYA